MAVAISKAIRAAARIDGGPQTSLELAVRPLF
jgi:hypothetical protein